MVWRNEGVPTDPGWQIYLTGSSPATWLEDDHLIVALTNRALRDKSTGQAIKQFSRTLNRADECHLIRVADPSIPEAVHIRVDDYRDAPDTAVELPDALSSLWIIIPDRYPDPPTSLDVWRIDSESWEYHRVSLTD